MTYIVIIYIIIYYVKKNWLVYNVNINAVLNIKSS